MANFNKAALLAAIQPKTVLVPIEGFGDVGVVQLTVLQVETLRETLKKEGQSDQFGLRMVQISVVDPDGDRVFDDGDLASLQSSSNSVVDTLVLKTLEVNGFKKAEAAKN
jgi:hypothetical protein